jgi:preprotein translocase subunit SecD
MFQKLNVRLAVIALAVLASVALLWRNYMRPDETGKPSGQMVTLGLDLQGGAQYALELDEARTALSDQQRRDAIDRALKVVRLRVEELSAGTGEPVIQKIGDHRIVVEIAGRFDQDRVRDVLQKSAFLEFQIVRPLTDVQAQLTALDPIVARAFPAETGPAAPAAPVNPTGGLLQSADSARRDSAAAPAQTPAVNPALNAAPLTSKLAAGGAGMFVVEASNYEAVRRYLDHPQVRAALPRGVELAWSHPQAEDNPGYRSLWVLESEAIMTGEHLQDAVAGPDQLGRPGVNFELSRRAGRRFEDATGDHIGDQMAIVIDNQVYTAPSIRGAIANRGIIELGGASLEEATDLALVLRAGALPAPLKIVSEHSVGPSLGADSIAKGKLAAIVGVLVVIVLMILFYKFAGVLAVVALMGYILFILGSLAFLGAALTFPGLAGLVLSIGMAVDANVLVFERIREELDRGRNVKVAISEGFQHALSAIVDSNLTTLITAVILYYLGTGPVRGFAVTLGVGIVASMFTAIFVTRTLFMLYLQRRSSAAQGLSI